MLIAIFYFQFYAGCGETASNGDESPWHVAVYKSGELACGATIICHKYVMTLASCTKDSTPSDVEVQAGLTSSGSFESKYQVKTIISHPLYDADTGSYDFSLLEVNYKQPFNIYQLQISAAKIGQFRVKICISNLTVLFL